MSRLRAEVLKLKFPLFTNCKFDWKYCVDGEDNSTKPLVTLVPAQFTNVPEITVFWTVVVGTVIVKILLEPVKGPMVEV